jgi:hypothetical protein
VRPWFDRLSQRRHDGGALVIGEVIKTDHRAAQGRALRLGAREIGQTGMAL